MSESITEQEMAITKNRMNDEMIWFAYGKSEWNRLVNAIFYDDAFVPSTRRMSNCNALYVF